MSWVFLIATAVATVCTGFKLWAGYPLDAIDKAFATMGMVAMCIDRIADMGGEA